MSKTSQNIENPKFKHSAAIHHEFLKNQMVIMNVLKNPEENTASENSPGHSNAKKTCFRVRVTFGETRVTFLRHMWQVSFVRVVLWGNSYGNDACFERSRCVNVVAVGDGELILWGMKAMP